MLERIRLPWALAAAAKVSIVSGNEHRKSGVSERDILEICGAYSALDTPLKRRSGEVTDTVAAFLVRLSNEQFIYQQSEFEEFCRLGALFDRVGDLKTEILSTSLVEELLGCSIAEFVGAGFVITTGAKINNGFFDPEWPRLWVGQDSVNSQFPMDLVRKIFHEHFLTSFEGVRQAAEFFRQEDETLRQHEFNPLVSRPFVTLPNGQHIAPQPHLAFHRISPSAVYFAGIEKLDEEEKEAFTRDIGVAFQDYVGRQLKLISGAKVLPEIMYGKHQRSVDWFVIFDDLVILVEAKSTRLSHLARMGGNRLREDIDRCLRKAYAQIARTNELLNQGHEAFAAIPKERPRIALIATMEPYWAANSSLLQGFLPEPTLPTSVASIRAIEHLIGVMEVQGGPYSLIEIVQDEERRNWNLETALPKVDIPKNSILEEIWRRYPFA